MAIRNINKEHKENLSIQERIALLITRGVGSMWCAYIFAALALIGLPDAIQAGRPAIIDWITQTFLQLVLLSIILVGQNVASKHSELRAEANYETDLKNEKETEEIKKSLEEIKKILATKN